MTECPDYNAMTVNERLFTANRMKEFDQAILLRNRPDAIAILAALEVLDPEKTVDAIFANLRNYGYH